MSVRSNAIVIALATLPVPAAFAQSAAVFVGGEAGWIDRPVAGSVTRDQVRSAYLALRANPIAPDGGRYVGGEMGYVFPQHTYAYQNGNWVCTDKIAHNAKPNAVKTSAERQAFQQEYPA